MNLNKSLTFNVWLDTWLRTMEMVDAIESMMLVLRQNGNGQLDDASPTKQCYILKLWVFSAQAAFKFWEKTFQSIKIFLTHTELKISKITLLIKTIKCSHHA